MKPSFKGISTIVLPAPAVGCAGPRQAQQTEELRSDAGFKPIAAGTAKPEQQLKMFTPGKVSQTQQVVVWSE